MGINFHWFGDRARERLKEAAAARLIQAGEVGLATMQGYCPVDTGYLLSTTGLLVKQAGMEIVLYADAPYAAPVEFGHLTVAGTHVPARPFVRPGLAAAAEALAGSDERVTTTGRYGESG